MRVEDRKTRGTTYLVLATFTVASIVMLAFVLVAAQHESDHIEARRRLSLDLIHAVEHLDSARVKSDLDKGADPNQRVYVPPKQRPLQALWSRINGIDVPVDASGCTVLEAALTPSLDTNGVYSGAITDKDVDVQAITVRSLLAHGANLNPGRSSTPPLIAGGLTHVALTRLLLEYHADPNTRDSTSTSALMYAVDRGDIAVVRALVTAGAHTYTGRAMRKDLIARAMKSHGADRSEIVMYLRSLPARQ